MSFTEHEVGQVAPQTDPTAVAAPKHLHYLLVAIISFLVPLAGLIMAVRYNKKVKAYNDHVEAPKASALNYWLVVGISVVLAFAAVAAVNLSAMSPRNATYIVVGTGPVAPTVQPSQAAPSAAAPAPAPSATPDTSGLAVQPLSSSASDLIAKVEAYRSQAFLAGDMKPLDNYYPSHQNMGWQHDYDEIVTGKTSGDISTITNIKLISVSNAKIVADVTIKDVGIVNGKTTTDVFTESNTYEVVNGRWYLTS